MYNMTLSRHINHFITNKRNFLITTVSIGLLLIGGAYYYRADVSLYVWDEFRLFPHVALSFNDKDARLSKSIGNYYFNRFGEGAYDLEKAKIYFNRALEIDSQIPRVWHQLARIDFLNGSFNSSLIKINKEINIHGEEFKNVYYMRALLYGFMKQFDNAEKDFLKFLELEEKSWAAHNDLAWIYFQQGEYIKAEEIARKGLLYNPDNPWLLTSLGVSLINIGDKDSARVALTKALSEAWKLTEEDWQNAYPGNDPRIAQQGLAEMIKAIESNLLLVVDS